MDVASTLLGGLAAGMVLFIVSVGLSVTMGLMGFVNLAHGGFAMLGGYFVVYGMRHWGLAFTPALALAFAGVPEDDVRQLMREECMLLCGGKPAFDAVRDEDRPAEYATGGRFAGGDRCGQADPAAHAAFGEEPVKDFTEGTIGQGPAAQHAPLGDHAAAKNPQQSQRDDDADGKGQNLPPVGRGSDRRWPAFGSDRRD